MSFLLRPLRETEVGATATGVEGEEEGERETLLLDFRARFGDLAALVALDFPAALRGVLATFLGFLAVLGVLGAAAVMVLGR